MKRKMIKSKIHLDDSQRIELKKVQVELLDVFINFCNEHHLQYYLYGGTLLGAIRHSGYIPWDDDIDVCMPRKDYDKFLEIFKSSDTYFLQTPETDPHYYYHFAKLLKRGTVYSEYILQKIDTIKCIFIDIFPINGIPKPKTLSFYHYNFWLFILNRRSRPKGIITLKKQNHSFSYNAMTILSYLLLWFIPSHQCAKLRDRFMKKHQYPKTEYCISGTNMRKIYKKNYFVGAKVVIFEKRHVRIPENYNGYLSAMYGDYMKLPKQEDRIPHHYLCDFKP